MHVEFKSFPEVVSANVSTQGDRPVKSAASQAGARLTARVMAKQFAGIARTCYGAVTVVEDEEMMNIV